MTANYISFSVCIFVYRIFYSFFRQMRFLFFLANMTTENQIPVDEDVEMSEQSSWDRDSIINENASSIHLLVSQSLGIYLPEHIHHVISDMVTPLSKCFCLNYAQSQYLM